MTRAPFTEEQVAALNAAQANPNLHPYTCGSGRRTDAAHLDGEGVLVATKTGWVCPYCDYRQDWCHTLLTDRNELKNLANGLF